MSSLKKVSLLLLVESSCFYALSKNLKTTISRGAGGRKFSGVILTIIFFT